MGPIRRTISLILALTFAIGGTVTLFLQLFYSDRVWLLMLFGSGVMAAAGFGWLWEDFIKRERQPED